MQRSVPAETARLGSKGLQSTLHTCKMEELILNITLQQCAAHCNGRNHGAVVHINIEE